MPDYFVSTPPPTPSIEDEAAANLADWAPIETTLEEDEEEQLQNVDREVSEIGIYIMIILLHGHNSLE